MNGFIVRTKVWRNSPPGCIKFGVDYEVNWEPIYHTFFLSIHQAKLLREQLTMAMEDKGEQ